MLEGVVVEDEPIGEPILLGDLSKHDLKFFKFAVPKKMSLSEMNIV